MSSEYTRTPWNSITKTSSLTSFKVVDRPKESLLKKYCPSYVPNTVIALEFIASSTKSSFPFTNLYNIIQIHEWKRRTVINPIKKPRTRKKQVYWVVIRRCDTELLLYRSVKIHVEIRLISESILNYLCLMLNYGPPVLSTITH